MSSPLSSLNDNLSEGLHNNKCTDCKSYVHSNTLLLADVFESFCNKCIKMYDIDPAHFLSAPRLAWQACLKKTEVELELLANIDMLLMVEIIISYSC